MCSSDLLIHGETASGRPLKTADKILEERVTSVVFGHVHRREMATKRTEAGEVFAASPGCLCRIDGAVPGSTERHNWLQGIVVVDAGPPMSLSFVAISDGVASFRGKQYHGRDRVDELIEATVGSDGEPWPF